LLKRDDKLVSVFRTALIETGQEHVACMLGSEGLYTFVVIIVTLSYRTAQLRHKPVLCEDRCLYDHVVFTTALAWNRFLIPTFLP